MKKKTGLLALIAVLSFTAHASATEWTNGGSDQAWNNAANWNTNAVPGAADYVYVYNNTSSTTGPIINSSTAAAVAGVGVAFGSSASDVLTMTGGSLTISDNGLILGNFFNNTGIFNLSGGTVTVANSVSAAAVSVGYAGGTGILNVSGGNLTTGADDILYVGMYGGSYGNSVNISGSGTVSTGYAAVFGNGAANPYAGGMIGSSGNLNMSGGVFNIGTVTPGYMVFGWNGSDSGDLNMTGGIINNTSADGRLYFGLVGTSHSLLAGGIIKTNSLFINGTSYLDITGTGTLILTGDARGQISGLVGTNQIRTDSGKTISAVYDGSYTTVTAIPEPATLCIFGLGYLGALLRRK